MGNLCACLEREPAPLRRRSPRRYSNAQQGQNSRKRSNRVRPSRNPFDDSMLEEQALAAAILFWQYQQNGGTSSPLNRSTLLHSPSPSGSKKAGQLASSFSFRARTLTDPLFQPYQLANQEIKHHNLESNHFVLVHGGGFGAWCWYKTMALLEEVGFKVTAIDLTGSGIHSCDINGITSLSQFVKPLIDFLENHANREKVILVGHDLGGTCISYAMELFPLRIAKAVFIAAVMLTNGQRTLDIFSQQAGSNDLMWQANRLLYANGNNHPPTAIALDKSLFSDLLFNQSPSKDVALASVLMKQIPFAPVLEKLSLSDMKYGSVRRFYIKTLEDKAIPITLQESMINSSAPEKVFRLKGADHSPFFSKPKALHKLLVEISKIPST